MNDEMIVSRALLRQALEALEWSVDTVQAEYDSDWRHGIPTRKAALDRMLEALNAHKSSITAIRTTLETAEKAEPVAGLFRTQSNKIECFYRGSLTPIDGHHFHREFVDCLPLAAIVPLYSAPVAPSSARLLRSGRR